MLGNPVLLSSVCPWFPLVLASLCCVEINLTRPSQTIMVYFRGTQFAPGVENLGSLPVLHLNKRLNLLWSGWGWSWMERPHRLTHSDFLIDPQLPSGSSGSANWRPSVWWANVNRCLDDTNCWRLSNGGCWLVCSGLVFDRAEIYSFLKIVIHLTTDKCFLLI